VAVRNRRLAAAGTLALFVALAAIHTWPLATDPSRLSRNDNADTILNEWIVAWVAHQSVTAPHRLFDANIFYPEPRTLAFSEHLVVPAMIGAPLAWLGASPVLVFNILLLAGFALTGWAMSLVVTRWTGDRTAGLLAGSLMAFNPHTLTRLPHLQAQHVEFLPFVLLAFDSLLRTPRWRTAFGLAVAFVLQGLCSNYLLVFTVVALGAAFVVRSPEALARPDRVRRFAALAAAAVIALTLLLPFILPYYLAQHEQGLGRSLDEVALYSAGWRDYLATPAKIHEIWSDRFSIDTTALFPGVVGLGLAVAAVVGVGFGDGRVRMLVAIGAIGVMLSFGPSLPGYAWLYDTLPLLQGIRGAARFGYLLLVAVAALAGLGMARLRTHEHGRRWIGSGSFALLVLVHVEAFRAPIEYRPFEGIPAVYDVLVHEPSAVVAEFPFFAPDGVARNAAYMLNSTRHWHPLLNGYSGFTPVSYVEHYQAVSEFPDTASIAALRRFGVSHAVVHLERYDAAGAKEMSVSLRSAKGLELVAEDGGIRIYRLTP
jgi:hypothetical protein